MGRPARTSELIAGIYDCVLRPESWGGVLEDIQREVGAISAYLLIHGTQPRNLSTPVERNVDPQMRRLYDEHYIGLNPLLPYLASVPSGEVYSCRHLVTQPGYLHSDFYREWAEPQGWFDYAGVTMVRKDHSSLAVGFTRAKQDDVFPDASLRLLGLLAPHLVRAAEIQNLLGLERQYRRDLTSIVEAARYGVLMVDGEGRVVEANPAAEALFALNKGLVGKDRLFAGAESVGLLGAIRAARENAGAHCGGTTQINRGPGRRPLILYILPLADPAPAPFAFSRPARAAVFVVDPERSPVGPLDAFAACYKLTKAEREVLQGLAAGSSPVAIAKALGIGLPTVRTHLHRLFDKTGVRRQAELIALLLGSLPPVRMR